MEAPQLSDYDKPSPSLPTELRKLLVGKALLNGGVQTAEDIYQILLTQLAGESWALKIEGSQSEINHELKLITLANPAEDGYSVAQIGGMVEYNFLHEVAHLLYTPKAADDLIIKTFAEVSPKLNPAEIAANFIWLQNVVADGRAEGKLAAKHPEYAWDVNQARESGLAYAALPIFILNDLGFDPSLSRETLSILPKEEQMGLMIMSILRFSSLKPKWSACISPDVKHCLDELEPLLLTTRDGDGVEYYSLLPAIYKILLDYNLFPKTMVKVYMARHISPEGIQGAAKFVYTLVHGSKPSSDAFWPYEGLTINQTQTNKISEMQNVLLGNLYSELSPITPESWDH